MRRRHGADKLNIHHNSKDLYDLWKFIPNQAADLQNGDEVVLYESIMKGAGSWGTWHGFVGKPAKVLDRREKSILFQREDGTLKSYRLTSWRLFKALRLAAGAENQDVRY
jgi:hypothetical protein